MPKFLSRIIIPVVLFSSSYAVIRYHIFKEVPWDHFPLFIMNKILSFSGIIILILGFALKPFHSHRADWLSIRRLLGRTGFVFILLHVLISVLLFRPEVYSKFFSPDGNLNALAEWSMLFGVVGLLGYLIMFYHFSLQGGGSFGEFAKKPVLEIVCLFVSSLHVGIMGFRGWFTPSEWPGGMPPITLLTIVIFLTGMVLYNISVKKT